MEKRRYSQLTLEGWGTIARLHQDGGSMRQIASIMGRAASSIAREIKRNSGTQIGYRPAYAEQQTLSRRWRGVVLNARPVCVTTCWGACHAVVPPNKWLADWLSSMAELLSATNLFIDLLMRKYAAPRTMLGAIICHAQKANAAGAGAKGEVLSSIFAIVSPLRLAHLTCKHANNLVIGRMI